MKTHEGLNKTSEPRVPAATDAQRRAMAAFLAHFHARISRTLDSLRQLTLTDTSESLQGQITYHKHQLATIAWLQSMNATRRKSAKATPAR